MFSLDEHVQAILKDRQLELIPPRYILPCVPVRIKILMIVDGSIGFGASGFGLKTVIDTLRQPHYSFAKFELTFATREGSIAEDIDPSEYEPRYRGFKFDRQEANGTPTINRYDQIWCFGLHPNTTFLSNRNNNNDELIEQATNRPLSNRELKVLTTWMNDPNKLGGVFATGDHDILGASMCYRIPRVSTMRKWTDAQGTPTVDGPTRHDTNRPENFAQANTVGGNPDQIPFNAQSDAIPQPIEVRRYPIGLSTVFARHYQPHPLLCHPQHGVIDVLPDHPHEGWIIEDALVDKEASYRFEDLSGQHYPSHPTTGVKPYPEVVAWANTLADPPYNHEKGTTAAKRFGVIGAYDGHRANVGRVVVDSTWHHWFNVNLTGLQAAPDQRNFQKVQAYFRNVALWMATPIQRSRMLSVAAWNSLFTIRAQQEFTRAIPIQRLGAEAKDAIGQRAGACLITQWTIDIFTSSRFEELREVFKLDPLCLSCPPFEMIEDFVLGGVVQSLLPLHNQYMKDLLDEKTVELDTGSLAKAILNGAELGLKEFSKTYQESMKSGIKTASILKQTPQAGLSIKQFEVPVK